MPENPLEQATLALGLVPTPFAETHPTLLLARAVMVATKLGVFEALGPGALTAQEVAARCRTHPGATRTLLNTLVSAGYLRAAGDAYKLAAPARKWLLKESPHSLYDSILFRFLEWEWIGRLEDFIQSGEPLKFHETMTPHEWSLYQRGMYALARLAAPELVRRTPVPKGARDLLDIGGSHGYFSVAFCRRHPGLRGVVLELPQAIEHAAPLLAGEGMGERVVHRAGDALSDDLGAGVYDLVLMSQLAHHFDEATNRALVRRIARALRPGGALVIQEIIRRESPGEGGQLAGLGDLYFALTSKAGAWSFGEMAGWQRAAGLAPKRPVPFRSLPGMGLQIAFKPRG